MLPIKDIPRLTSELLSLMLLFYHPLLQPTKSRWIVHWVWFRTNVPRDSNGLGQNAHMLCPFPTPTQVVISCLQCMELERKLHGKSGSHFLTLQTLWRHWLIILPSCKSTHLMWSTLRDLQCLCTANIVEQALWMKLGSWCLPFESSLLKPYQPHWLHHLFGNNPYLKFPNY